MNGNIFSNLTGLSGMTLKRNLTNEKLSWEEFIFNINFKCIDVKC